MHLEPFIMHSALPGRAGTSTATGQESSTCWSLTVSQRRNVMQCLTSRAAQQFLKWGVQVRERSERKKFFWPPPHFWLTWGGHKTGYYSFHYCNYDV